MPSSDLDLPLLPSAEQIRRREFATIRRGYDPDQVRDYLEAVATQVQTLERDLKDARMRVDAAATPAPPAPSTPAIDPYERVSQRFAGLLATADREASRLIDDAKTEADRVLDEAKTAADRITVDAQARAEEAKAEGAQRLEDAKTEADRILRGLSARREVLMGQLQDMRAKLLGVADELEISIESSDEPAEDPTSTSIVTSAEGDAEAEAEAPSGAQPDIVDPRYEDLWVSSEPEAASPPTTDDSVEALLGEDAEGSIEIPDLASIELDFDDDHADG
jgi:DivIVA domain-containing protein